MLYDKRLTVTARCTREIKQRMLEIIGCIAICQAAYILSKENEIYAYLTTAHFEKGTKVYTSLRVFYKTPVKPLMTCVILLNKSFQKSSKVSF